MISKFTKALLISLKGKASGEKLDVLNLEIVSKLDNSVKREINIAIRMLELGKFTYQTDGFNDDITMNEIHNEIFGLLEIETK
jgi:hypothetical protein